MTTTGQPAASAEAVSPPATENANGKLLAANTATGPMARSTRRRSGRGGTVSGLGESMVASTKLPSRSTSPNSRSWLVVRFSSVVSRGSPSAVSPSAVDSSRSASASKASATWSSTAARSAAGRFDQAGNAVAAAAQIRSTSLSTVDSIGSPNG